MASTESASAKNEALVMRGQFQYGVLPVGGSFFPASTQCIVEKPSRKPRPVSELVGEHHASPPYAVRRNGDWMPRSSRPLSRAGRADCGSLWRPMRLSLAFSCC
jgi:hypothetical protein